jgi:hypothetical protein
MGALDDNLEVLSKTDTGAGEWGRAATNDLVRSKIKIKSLNFMRGRTFLNKYVIIDEAQNLTPKQMKTLITRAGPGTKIVCLGNLAQIDTPYLTEGSSGLTFAVDRFKGWPHSGHVTWRAASARASPTSRRKCSSGSTEIARLSTRIGIRAKSRSRLLQARRQLAARPTTPAGRPVALPIRSSVPSVPTAKLRTAGVRGARMPSTRPCTVIAMSPALPFPVVAAAPASKVAWPWPSSANWLIELVPALPV